MSSLTVLFWNLNCKPLAARVARLAAAHGVDVVALAECETPAAEMVAALATSESFHSVPESGDKLSMYSRFLPSAWSLRFQDTLHAWTGYRLSRDGVQDLLFVVAHLPSKRDASSSHQGRAIRSLARDILTAERDEGHARTILVGDLNVNPFEVSMVESDGLHAIMTRADVQPEGRTVRGRREPMFYNPMWGLFGDRSPGPAGTYYRKASDALNYFWNMYDQVLLRPGLMDSLVELRILDSDGTDSLLSANGRPDTKNGSDHLPVLFRLEG